MMNKQASVLFLIPVLFFLSVFSCNGNDSGTDTENITESDIESPDPDIPEPVNCVYEEKYLKDISVSVDDDIWRYFLWTQNPKSIRFYIKEVGEHFSSGSKYTPAGSRSVGFTSNIYEEDSDLLEGDYDHNLGIGIYNYFEPALIDGLKNLKAPVSIYLKVILFPSVEGEAASKEIYTIRDGDGDLIIAVVSMVTEEENEALEIWPAECLPEFDAKQIMPEEGCIENANLVESDDGFVTNSYLNPFLEVKHVPSGQTVVAMEHEYKDLENFKIYVYSSGKAGPKDYDGLLSFIGRKWSFSFFAVSKKILE